MLRVIAWPYVGGRLFAAHKEMLHHLLELAALPPNQRRPVMRKTIVGVLLALSLTACAMPAQNGSPISASKSTASASQEAAESGMKPVSKDDMPGVVLALIGDDEGLTILPIEDADSYDRKATKKQVRACMKGAPYPACLP
ncbi:hypothetical protein AB0F17_08145 [Nonomuraea sp. NPDC026600]|uniref:hypothetical protein n=1 Tax=Nonomuraea sp. NPDC026600 TaxID=3155363 RepID=UPI0033E5F7A6